MKSLLRILSTVILVSFVIVFIGIFIWGMPGMSFEVPGYKLTETYLTIGDYSIGKQKFQYNICHKKDGCLNGKILGLKETKNNIYIYIKINYGNVTITSKTGNKSKFYDFDLYKKSDRITVNNLNELPTFGYLIGNKLEFYSKNDLSKLQQEQQNIFKELEKNPTIIIDGKKYE